MPEEYQLDIDAKLLEDLDKLLRINYALSHTTHAKPFESVSSTNKLLEEILEKGLRNKVEYLSLNVRKWDKWDDLDKIKCTYGPRFFSFSENKFVGYLRARDISAINPDDIAVTS